MSKEICGAKCQDGSKCQRKAGWGTDNDSGFCKFHLESRNSDIKSKYLEILKDEVISLGKAAQRINRNPSTIRKWRNQDKEFGKKVEEAKRVQEELRGQKLKDSVFKRAIKGEATGAETIFALKNTTNWSNDPETLVQVAQEQTQQKRANVTIKKNIISEKEAKKNVESSRN